jgi:hypothetical protein
VLALASPTLWPKERDDFPLSPYAMFSTRQDDTTTVTHVVAVYEDGREIPLAPRFLGTDEVLQAKVTLMRVLKRGKREQMELCWDLAKKVAADRDLSGAFAVEMRTVTYRTMDYFVDPKAALLKKNVHAHCRVDR